MRKRERNTLSYVKHVEQTSEKKMRTREEDRDTPPRKTTQKGTKPTKKTTKIRNGK